MTHVTNRPATRPRVPNFSSGPCTKRPGLEPRGPGRRAARPLAPLGHRQGQAEGGIDLTRSVLQVPADYRIGIVPASDTGAVEMAMWSMLGPKTVEVVACEAFGLEWVTDALKELKIAPRVHVGDYGILPDLSAVDTRHNDVIFTWNGTAAGVRVPDGD